MTATPTAIEIPKEGPAQRPRLSKIPDLDGLRAIAVALVFWAHVPREVTGELMALASVALQPNYLGVDIFFVLSGFLITRILLVDKDIGAGLKGFYARRALRIFPIYYLTLAICAFAAPPLHTLWSAIYVQNFAFSFDMTASPLRHTWSLAVEEHFYLFWPFLVMWLARETSRKVAIGLIVTALVLGQFVIWWGQAFAWELLYRGTMFRMASLLAGALMAYHEKDLVADVRGSTITASRLVVVGAVILAAEYALKTAMAPLSKLFGFMLVSSGVVLAAVVWNGRVPAVSAILGRGPIAYLGRVSYGLYLYHFPIFYALGVFHEGTSAERWRTLAAIVISVAVAAASFELIERPILRLKERFR